MSRILKEQRVSRDRPCPACGHTSPWCYFLAGGDAVWCGHAESMIGASGKIVPGRERKGGWIHQLRDNRKAAPFRRAPVEERSGPPLDYERLARQFSDAIRKMRPGDDAPYKRFAEELGVGEDSLRRLNVGWATASILLETNTICRENAAWSFPMKSFVNGKLKTTGIRLRAQTSSFKFSVRGSDGSGLYVPSSGIYRGMYLLLPEGPTDTAALLTLGFSAVGRPNCRAGLKNIQLLIQKYSPVSVLLVGDNDQPDAQGRRAGQDGARWLTAEILKTFSRVRCVLPPAKFKDCREWLKKGATSQDVSEVFGLPNCRRITA